MPRYSPHVLSAFCAGLVACAADAMPPAPTLEWRVLVKLVQVGSEAEAIARRAGQASGVPVRYLASVSPQWHSLGLDCGDETRCAAALQRLRADASYFEAVERDERRRPHSDKPSNPS
jgi:hypothetical protein